MLSLQLSVTSGWPLELAAGGVTWGSVHLSSPQWLYSVCGGCLRGFFSEMHRRFIFFHDLPAGKVQKASANP